MDAASGIAVDEAKPVETVGAIAVCKKEISEELQKTEITEPTDEKKSKENGGAIAKTKTGATTKADVKEHVQCDNPQPSTSGTQNNTSPNGEELLQPEDGCIFQLKISLIGITPEIWRRIQIPSQKTFDYLHLCIQEAMGWQCCHRHTFRLYKPDTGMIEIGTVDVNVIDDFVTSVFGFKQSKMLSEKKTKLPLYFTKKDFVLEYEYDFGDLWIHEVCLEKILRPVPGTQYPQIKGGQRACPPENCGGVSGYYKLLKVYKNPYHREYKDLIVGWLQDVDPGWQPKKYNGECMFKPGWRQMYEACLVLVAAFWGGTNPLIKSNSKEITKIKADSKVKQFVLEIKYLATNIKYLVPMALNQMGSVIYFLTLQKADLSLSVPLANSLTFVFTAISGWILGEQLPKKNTIFGVILVLTGTTLCCYDNYLNSVSYLEKKEIT